MHVSAAVTIPFLNMSVRPAPESSLFGKGGVALKPPLYARHRCPTDENDIYFSNETMDLLTENQEGSLDQQKSHKAELEYDDDDDFMMRFVDGTCRGIFPADNDEDIEKRSLCQLPSCHLGERLDVLLVSRKKSDCSLFTLSTETLRSIFIYAALSTAVVILFIFP
jgi:hypothetical protein